MRASVASSETRRGSRRSAACNWSRPLSTAKTLRAPRCSRTWLKPPVERADIERDAALDTNREGIQREGELDAAARDIGMGRRREDLGIGGDGLGRLADGNAARRDQPRGNRLLRPGAALEEATLDEKEVGALAHMQRQARFGSPSEASLPRLSLPSASKTLATIPAASRPARA